MNSFHMRKLFALDLEFNSCIFFRLSFFSVPCVLSILMSESIPTSNQIKYNPFCHFVRSRSRDETLGSKISLNFFFFSYWGMRLLALRLLSVFFFFRGMRFLALRFILIFSFLTEGWALGSKVILGIFFLLRDEDLSSKVPLGIFFKGWCSLALRFLSNFFLYRGMRLFDSKIPLGYKLFCSPPQGYHLIFNHLKSFC
jgi:hypothetical protein